MKKKLSFVLAAAMLLSLLLTACNTAAPEDYAKRLEDQYLMQAGTSNYVLVLPENQRGQEAFAAEEFNHFFTLATGTALQVVSENSVSAGSNYISLGKTAQFIEAVGEAELAPLEGTYSDYLILSKNDNIYIASSDTYNGSGVLYGVYDLLGDLIGYNYYHENEIAYTKSDTVNLWHYEKHIETPSFDMRTHSTAYIYSDGLRNARFRYTRFSPSEEWDQITIGHSQVPMFVSPLEEDPETGDTYGQMHPEWFFDPAATSVTKNNNQLCWTAGGSEESLEKLVNACAVKMAEYVDMNTEATFFMFGQMDTEYVCQCDSCRKAQEEWGGSACGLQIAFVNALIEKTEELIAPIKGEREILYAIYAYKPTEPAPVKKNADGTYAPYSDRVIPHEKMRIFFAPIRTNYGFPLDAPVNIGSYEALKGWDVVCDKDQLMAYMYDLNIRYYFANFFNFGTLASMYQDLEEAGVSYLLSQGVSDTWICCFDELRAYCISNLMWDNSLNFNDLAADFIQNYYKDGGDAMQQLYEMIRDRNAYYVAVEDPGSATPDGVLYSTKLYPRSFVNKMDEQIFAALDAVSHLEDTDPEQYALLKARIMKEYLSNIYLKMTLYKDSYSDSEIVEMEQLWNTYTAYWNITHGGEGNRLPELFN